MNFRKLKELVNKLGGLLVLDGDEPAFVVLSYDKYQKIDLGEEIPVSSRNSHNGLDETIANGIGITDELTVEKLNQEIFALKEEIRQREEAELVANGQSTEPIAETVDFD
ncbi:MAG: hypothetical protein HYT65_02100 [Candidatus Yanofskybacteria bacterium]|nr:hypothetical protein [Candidatus Yanofskybacteria bacterium]